MKRILITCLCLMFFSHTAHGLSLGGLSVKSGYSQPFDGEISIPLYSDDEVQELYVNLAPISVFDQHGIEYSQVLANLKFAVRYKSDGTPYIAVRTNDPINELMLSFIIEASWPNGNMVKAFDVLLTPAAMLEKDKPTEITGSELSRKEKLVTEIRLPGAQEEVISESIEPEEKEIPRKGLPRAAFTQTGPAEWSYGPVQPGQSLSEIAEQFHEVSDFSIEKRMNILFRLNPEAFGDNNINRVRAGYTLKYRNAAELTSPQSSLPETPEYIDDIEANRRMGVVDTQSPAPLAESEFNNADVSDLRNTLKNTRDKVSKFREQNEELRARLHALEVEVATKAKELGIQTGK